MVSRIKAAAVQLGDLRRTCPVVGCRHDRMHTPVGVTEAAVWQIVGYPFPMPVDHEHLVLDVCQRSEHDVAQTAGRNLGDGDVIVALAGDRNRQLACQGGQIAITPQRAFGVQY